MDDRPATTSTSGESEVRLSTPPSSSSSSQRTPRPNWNRSLSDQTLENGQRSPTKDASRPRSKGLPAKKKPNGVLGFLTLKEPSTRALEEFAAAEKEKARAKGNRNSMTRPSTQKLPNHVPKVNSKWDGKLLQSVCFDVLFDVPVCFGTLTVYDIGPRNLLLNVTR